jgi:hypothetical protein
MTLIAGPSLATVDTLAADGRVVRIRPAIPADADELLEHLAAQARAAGVRDLSGQVLPENSRMLRVARSPSAREHLEIRDQIVDVDLATTADDTTQTAADERNARPSGCRCGQPLQRTAVSLCGPSRPATSRGPRACPPGAPPHKRRAWPAGPGTIP